MSTEMNSKPIRKNIVFIMFMLSYFLISTYSLFVNNRFLNFLAELGDSLVISLLGAIVIWGLIWGLILALLAPYPFRGSSKNIHPIGVFDATVGAVFIGFLACPPLIIYLAVFLIGANLFDIYKQPK